AQVRAHLAGLNTSQRLAIGLCVVLVVVSMVWLLRWSAQPEMVPVLFEGFEPEQLLQAEAELRVLGIPYRVEGRKIYVRLADRDRVLVRLGERQMLPADTSLTIEKLIEQDSPFRSQADSRRIWAYAKDKRLSRLLSGFRGIQRATVVIDKPARRGIGRQAAAPTASVLVWTRPGYELSPENVDAIAGFVSRAEVGLEPTRVGIIDGRTGRQYRVRQPDSPIAFDLLELAKKTEEHYRQKILDQLRTIPGVLVNVFAELEASSRRVEDRRLSEPIDIETEITKKTEVRSGGGGEPGVRPNVGQAVAAGGPAEQSEEKTERIKSTPSGERVEVSETGLGVIKRLTASVSVPRSYLVGIYQQQPGNEGKEPSDKELLAGMYLEGIRKQVMPLVRATDPSQVQVSMYYDSGVGAAVAEVASAGTDLLGLARSYARQLGLGALAVVSLFMLLLLARRAPAGELAGEAGLQPSLAGVGGGPAGQAQRLNILTAETPPVGDVPPRSGVLIGRELDETTVRTREMIEQLAQMVREDPAGAAGLVRRWLDKEAV
ncbi:MAG: hypothetical protein ACE5K7_07670, partial [Phycisphaerae bacterium]